MHREGKFGHWRQYLGPPPETFDAFLQKWAFHLRHSPLFTILLCSWVCIWIYKFTCDSLVIHLWLSCAIKSEKEQISWDIKQFLIKVSKLAETSSRNRISSENKEISWTVFDFSVVWFRTQYVLKVIHHFGEDVSAKTLWILIPGNIPAPTHSFRIPAGPPCGCIQNCFDQTHRNLICSSC